MGTFFRAAFFLERAPDVKWLQSFIDAIDADFPQIDTASIPEQLEMFGRVVQGQLRLLEITIAVSDKLITAVDAELLTEQQKQELSIAVAEFSQFRREVRQIDNN
jgi:hypothetical protein